MRIQKKMWKNISTSKKIKNYRNELVIVILSGKKSSRKKLLKKFFPCFRTFSTKQLISCAEIETLILKNFWNPGKPLF